MDKDALKPQLVPAMIALSGASDKAIRAHIAESISLMAEPDFPERWPDLIDVRQLNSTHEPNLTDFNSRSTTQQLVQSLSSSNMNINLGVLETAHSIFREWRSRARSDAFWSIIKLVRTANSLFRIFHYSR